MSDIFISYAREDRDKAGLLARVFQQQNWDVWWDKVIPPGGKYSDVIGAELASAKAVIVLWSTSSVASDWVKDEAQEGVNRHILVPALIDKVSPPYGFRQVQTADLSDWDGSADHAELQSLVRSVSGLINKPVSDAVVSTDHRSSNRRRLAPYLFGAAVFLIMILGFAAYRLYRYTTPDDQQRQIGDGSQGGSNRQGGNTSQPNGPATPCDAEPRHRAANLTGTGLTMIDPGGNQAAAVLQFNEAISECAGYPDAYFWRGQSFVALKQNEKAIADFKKTLELATDDDMRQRAQKFIAALERPPATPVPTQASVNTNASFPNVNGTKFDTPIPTPHPGEPVHAQVNDIFAADKSTRIGATTRLIIERKHDPVTVKMSVNSALAHPDNKSGVINTLVYLENVDPVILKQNRAEIEKLLKVSQVNGTQTAEHVQKVQALLNQ